jgi:hypothetical protein
MGFAQATRSMQASATLITTMLIRAELVEMPRQRHYQLPSIHLTRQSFDITLLLNLASLMKLE